MHQSTFTEAHKEATRLQDLTKGNNDNDFVKRQEWAMDKLSKGHHQFLSIVAVW